MKKVTGTPIETVEELVEELPDNSARYILLSYPMKLADGRIKSPFVMLYWRPPTCGQESKMLYAGAVELMREKAGVSKYVYYTRPARKKLNCRIRVLGELSQPNLRRILAVIVWQQPSFGIIT